MLSMARAFAGEQVGAGEDPVEAGIVVADRLAAAADVAEEFADLVLAAGQAPLGEVDLGIAREQVEDGAAAGGDAAVVVGLEVFERDRLALLVGHRLTGEGHGMSPSFT
jgi:hypothetical protein